MDTSTATQAASAPVRLVACDLDGTLIGPDHRFSPRLVRVVSELKDRGVHFTLATGRMYTSARKLAEELGLDDVPLITLNGALVRMSRSGEVLLERNIPEDVARAVVESAKAEGHYIQTYHGDRLVVAELGPEAVAYAERTRVDAHVARTPAELWQGATKLLVIADPAVVTELMNRWRPRFGRRLALSRSFPYYLEVMAAGVSKGQALRHVASHLGVPLTQALAMGDGENDRSMLRSVGVGVAMEGAPPDLLRVARHVAPPFDKDGAAIALERWALGATA